MARTFNQAKLDNHPYQRISFRLSSMLVYKTTTNCLALAIKDGPC